MSKKRSSSQLDNSSQSSQTPRKRRKCISEDEKDSENDDTNSGISDLDLNSIKTVTINGESADFLLSELIQINFFKTRYSSNWTQGTPTSSCTIQGDSIHFGMDELNILIQFLSASHQSQIRTLQSNSPPQAPSHQMPSPIALQRYGPMGTPYTPESDIESVYIRPTSNTNSSSLSSGSTVLIHETAPDIPIPALSVLRKHDLFHPDNDFVKLRSFLNCLDFFCLLSLLTVESLCTLYHGSGRGADRKISISDLHKLHQIDDDLVHSVATKLQHDVYVSTVHQRVLSLKSNILKFQINDEGFSLTELDESEWFNKKMNEFCLFRRQLSRDWLMIIELHHSLQQIFIGHDLYDPILTATKSMFDAFCRFCTINGHHIDGHHWYDQRRKSNILNDVKLCTFPIIQLLCIMRYFVMHFDAVCDGMESLNEMNSNQSMDQLKQQTIDLVSMLPTILKCGMFCGLKHDDPNGRFKCCDRADDVRFINLMERKDERKQSKDNVRGIMVDIYEEIIDLLMDKSQVLNGDTSIVETLVLPVAKEVMSDEEWVKTLFKKCQNKEMLLLSDELRRHMIDKQLEGQIVDYSYMCNDVQRCLSHQ